MNENLKPIDSLPQDIKDFLNSDGFDLQIGELVKKYGGQLILRFDDTDPKIKRPLLFRRT